MSFASIDFNKMRNHVLKEEEIINELTSSSTQSRHLMLETIQPSSKIEFKEYHETSDEVAERLKIEELEELNKILADMDAIHEINKLLVEHLQEQKENLKEIEDCVIKTNETLDTSNIELMEAKEHQTSYFYTKTGAVILVTAVVTCPVTWVVGIKAGVIAGTISLISSFVTVNVT